MLFVIALTIVVGAGRGQECTATTYAQTTVSKATGAALPMASFSAYRRQSIDFDIPEELLEGMNAKEARSYAWDYLCDVDDSDWDTDDMEVFYT